MSESKSSLDHHYLSADSPMKPPYVEFNKYLVAGELHEFKGALKEVYSPIFPQQSTQSKKGFLIGKMPQLTENEGLQAVEAAYKAFDCGLGEWPQSHVKKRIAAVEKFIEGLLEKRMEIVNLLMWEICKTEDDAKKEVDRTVQYIKDTIVALKKLENEQSTFEITSGVIGHVRRCPYGVVLVLGPFNYPLNETYTTLIPAILMGNTVVLKLPNTGALCHTPTMELFQKCFPPGVVNVVSGRGTIILPSIMKSGKLDIFAFIGTNKAADELQKLHPAPHRLRVCLGLDAKNPGIIFPSANLDVAVNECILGSLSFNGQRCTALKVLFVHEDIAEQFVQKFAAAVDKLKLGLPWEKDTKITPLAEPDKPEILRGLIQDATEKGAKVVNKNGNTFDRSLVPPSVLFPVNKEMKIFHHEQFGPVVPIATFKEMSDIYTYLKESPYGQQASIFSTDTQQIAKLVDVLVNQVARVNINTQCQRGPDSMPFTGRKDSAYGTLSVFDALRVFSIRSLVAAKQNKENEGILSEVVQGHMSNFLRMDYMF